MSAKATQFERELEEESADVIEDVIESSEWFYDFGDEDYQSDRISSASFDAEGLATAVVVFGSCVAAKQVDRLQDDELWGIESIHADGDDVSVHLRERLD